jgi:hypothetical protein
MKSKKLTLSILLLFALVVSTATYAYWASNINGPANETTTGTVNIGEGKTVTTSFVLTGESNTGGKLVPANQLANSETGSVDQVVISYDIRWTEDGENTQLDGTTSTANITATPVVTVVNASGTDVTSTVGDLIQITNEANPTNLTLDAAAETFSYVITMTEPANQAEYNAIVNGTVTITITYELGAITTTDN